MAEELGRQAWPKGLMVSPMPPAGEECSGKQDGKELHLIKSRDHTRVWVTACAQQRHL